jgi:SRSO17 transposase
MGVESKSESGRARFAAYGDAITMVLGHAGRAAALRSHCTGLLLPGDRKGVKPMTASEQPERVRAAHQSFHHFVAKADWTDDAVLSGVRAHVLPAIVLPAIERQGPIRAWINHDTGVPMKGTHSVGVARQYCGWLEMQDNCQVVVTLSVAKDHASLPIAHHLYLPRPWAGDPARRARASVPEEVTFQTKPKSALAQIRAALQVGITPATVLADAGYNTGTEIRDGITALDLSYVAAFNPRPACGLPTSCHQAQRVSGSAPRAVVGSTITTGFRVSRRASPPTQIEC